MSPLKIFQASCSDKKQGIVAVLSSDSTHSKFQPSSLRRTLSADMSSHKWISQMKKVASFQEFTNPKTEHEKTEQSQKDCFLSHLYVNPLAKNSGKCLSEKSLEICTESLGSETGSDGFSSYPSSENGDSDGGGGEESVDVGMKMFEVEDEQPKAVKYSYKKSPRRRRSFPPPLPTLSGPDGESLRVQSRRDNGRLVLEAMSVISTNNFRVQRQDGRLVLTLVNSQSIIQVDEDDDHPQQEEKEEEKYKKITKSPELPSGLLNAHRLASMMNNKSIVIPNRNPSLPPRPKAAQPIIICAAAPVAASLNAYEYYWRSKTVNPLGQQPASFKNNNNNNKKDMICKNRTTTNEEHKLVVLSSSKGSCKEMRRTVVFWEPRCIATS